MSDLGRPKGLGAMAIGLFIVHLLTLPVLNLPYLARYAPYYATTTAITAFILWKLWQGRNWARWAVLVASVASIGLLYYVFRAGPAQRFFLIDQAAFGAWLLYWLNTREVRAFYRGRRELSAA